MATDFPNPPLTVGQVFVSNGSVFIWDGTKWTGAGGALNVITGVTAGAGLTGGGTGPGAVTLSVAPNGVTNALAAQMAADTLKGNNTGATANAADLTVSQVQALLGYITGNQPITISGDVSGSGATAITATLGTVNANVGTFQGITVNAKGLVTAAANQGYLTGNQTVTLSGDISGSGATAITATLATVNSNVGTFQGLTVNGKGLVTAAVNQNYAPLASPTFTGTVTIPAGASISGFAPLASPTFTGTAAFVGTDLTIPATVTASGSATVTWTNGECQNVSLTANSTLAVSGWPASGKFAKLILIIANTGAFNITAWPTGTVWAGGAAPTITSGSGVTDIIMLSTNNGGTTIYGNIIGQNYH